MDTETLHSFFFQKFISLKKLLFCKSVFCITRVIHDTIAQCIHSARIITQTHGLWERTDRFLQKINMGKIIQIDRRTNLICIYKLFCRCIIGGKHDLLTGHAKFMGKHQLCHRRTVSTTSVLS